MTYSIAGSPKASAGAGTATLDHIVLACPDLDAAVEAFTRLTGVAPEFGGAHTLFGTCNYLCSLGGARYLELIGPDPKQDWKRIAKENGGLPFGLEDLMQPGVVAWAAQTDALSEAADAAPWIGKPMEMSRKLPNGTKLQWALATHLRTASAADKTLPFFIDWRKTYADELHPAQTSPKGCALVSLELGHPNPDAASEQLAAAGFDVTTTDGSVVLRRSEASLSTILDTPNGRVELTEATLQCARAKL